MRNGDALLNDAADPARHRSPSLQGRILALVAIVAAPLVLLAGTAVWYAYREERAHVEALLQDQAAVMALVIDREFARAQALLEGLAASSSLARSDLAAYRAEALAASRAQGGQAIALATPDGRQIDSTLWPADRPRDGVRANAAVMSVFSLRRPAFSDIFTGANSGHLALGVGVPVFAATKPGTDTQSPATPPDVIYALGTGFSAPRLASLLASGPIPAGWRLGLLDRQGRLVARNPRDDLLTGITVIPPLLQAMEAGDHGLVRARTSFGVDSVIAFARAAQTGYVVTIAVPDEAFLGPLRRTLLRTGLAGGGIVIAGVALAALLATAMSRSLRELAHAPAGGTAGRRGFREVDELRDSLRRAAAERDRAEAALRDGEARIRETIESLPLITALYGADGIMEFCNRRFAEYFGRELSPDAAEQLALTHPDDRATSADARARALAEGSGYEIEVRLRRRDDAYRWHRATVVPLHNRAGVLIGFITTLIDIDDAKQAEQVLVRMNAELEARVAERTKALTDAARELSAEMQRRQEAQTALLQAQKLEALGQLIGGVAHDFNNVLAAIIGSYELIRRRTKEEKVLALVEQGERAAERATFLARRLVGFARREDLKPGRVELSALLAEVAEVLPHSIGAGIECVIEAPTGVWPVLADGRALEVALINLGVNARDAMPEGGTLRITARNLAAGATLPPALPPGDYVAISVQDSGTGMPPEVLARALEPFFTTKGPGEGSGLGLPMVYGLASQLGGGLRIESVVGEGTTVEIVLPRATVDLAAVGEGAKTAPAPHGEGSIVLVEDDEQVRAVTASFLRELGYHVAEAGNAAAGYALATSQAELDLVVTDVVMPGTDGVALAARLRADRPELPILFVTGYVRDTGTLEGERVLYKPYTIGEIGGAVREILRGR